METSTSQKHYMVVLVVAVVLLVLSYLLYGFIVSKDIDDSMIVSDDANTNETADTAFQEPSIAEKRIIVEAMQEEDVSDSVLSDRRDVLDKMNVENAQTVSEEEKRVILEAMQ